MPEKQIYQQLKPEFVLLEEKKARILALKEQAEKAGTEEEAERFFAEAQSLLEETKDELTKFEEKLPGHLEKELNLKEQYESQVKILENTGILQEFKSGEKGIIGIDGNEYPIPTYGEVKKRAREKHEMLETKSGQGFVKLQLVPFGMSLDVLHEKLGETLVRHHREGKLFATKKDQNDPNERLEALTLNEGEPIYVSYCYDYADKDGTLIYDIESITEDAKTKKVTHVGGKTKNDIVKESGAWQISFIEDLPNLPGRGEGKNINGRHQLEGGKSPIEYLNILRADPQYANESGITPEDWATLFLTHLEETNQVIDDLDGNGKFSWNIGGYFAEGSSVPSSWWGRSCMRALLLSGGVSDPISSDCARTRVRI